MCVTAFSAEQLHRNCAAVTCCTQTGEGVVTEMGNTPGSSQRETVAQREGRV